MQGLRVERGPTQAAVPARTCEEGLAKNDAYSLPNSRQCLLVYVGDDLQASQRSTHVNTVLET